MVASMLPSGDFLLLLTIHHWWGLGERTQRVYFKYLLKHLPAFSTSLSLFILQRKTNGGMNVSFSRVVRESLQTPYRNPSILSTPSWPSTWYLTNLKLTFCFVLFFQNNWFFFLSSVLIYGTSSDSIFFHIKISGTWGYNLEGLLMNIVSWSWPFSEAWFHFVVCLKVFFSPTPHSHTAGINATMTGDTF